MESLLYISAIIVLLLALVPGLSCVEYITPNFTASYLQFIEDHGAFLLSRNGSFKAGLYNPGVQQIRFYLCVIHVASNTVIWTANRDGPVSNAGTMKLSSNGILVSDVNGNKKWSTPLFPTPVSGLSLTEDGNLVLLDGKNASLWNSFDHPGDTIVIGQKLPVGTWLTSSVSDTDFSAGEYNLSATASDVILEWEGSPYWRLTMDVHANRNSNHVAEYLAIERDGLYLYASNGSVVVIEVKLSDSDFRVAKISADGKFIVSSYSDTKWEEELVGPSDNCMVPFVCGKLGLCTSAASSKVSACSCPTSFHVDLEQTDSCMPNDESFSLPLACNSSSNMNSTSLGNVSYYALGIGRDYFGVRFMDPIRYGIKFSACQDLCSRDCTCLGFFYRNSTSACYTIRNKLGSIMLNTDGLIDQSGYIKTVLADPTSTLDKHNSRRHFFPLIALILFSTMILATAFGYLCWKKWRDTKVGMERSGYESSSDSEELEAFSVPGLPVRYDYEELKTATEDFSTPIGSGGFGIVYKGSLPDKTVVAVKKITNLGVQGKKEFCTEIAIIGNIHHVNLVKLKGFCAQGSQRLLVYEYMNHGSLDHILFGNGPALEWQERFNIALGTAHGLAYLHNGCQHKIIHCDVKPENILLQDHFHPKLSDFGLSKLLNPEQSSHFTTMRGTRGYLAPEWLTSSAISEKTDVYSYGMVLLELISGRKNSLQNQSLDEENINSASSFSSGAGITYFPMLALEMHEIGRYLELADPRLEGRVTSEEVEKLVRIALCCVHEEPALRPNITTVVGMLEGRIPSGCPTLESLNFLRFYGRRFSEPSIIEEGEQSDHDNNASGNTTGDTLYCNFMSFIASEQISGPR